MVLIQRKQPHQCTEAIYMSSPLFSKDANFKGVQYNKIISLNAHLSNLKLFVSISNPQFHLINWQNI